jgi:hypothetical protein
MRHGQHRLLAAVDNGEIDAFQPKAKALLRRIDGIVAG